jgi:hypothetical protein
MSKNYIFVENFIKEMKQYINHMCSLRLSNTTTYWESKYTMKSWKVKNKKKIEGI